ncbi:SbcC/MukB-like Walker B domain-containing protein [Thiobacillus sp. 63-78]|uniref:SbcC/MukB-like Walker B domain-containing protein n=1 Tax=Thiobacillus sp. 63-78 TaxID=1895859 RepID=UPI000AA9C858|nr:SbcC/MukB-like Walker B domain-containing protein [Thiobacillus sp. 63-78]
MKYLESINLVQFFLYEREHIRVTEITGLFGANGSGKSSFLDAVQIAMFGANSRLMALNAQADENKTTRSIRSYCLGQYGDTPDDRVRPNSNTYITLVWRDSETNKPVSMGVCIYASKDREQHDVLGRYLLPDVELTLGDHLETVDGKEKPREWAAFKQQLMQRSKVSGDECLFQEAERYIRACLLELRGSGGTPSYDAFVRAFRFALRMRFDKTVDEIVRNDVLESRPTNIKKFKDVTDSFRRLAEMVAHVEKKIVDGTAVHDAFDNAAKASRKAVTWKALGLDAAREHANQAKEQCEHAQQEAQEAFETADKTLRDLKEKQGAAEEKAAHYRGLREQHGSHADYAGLESQIIEHRNRAARNTKGISDQLSQFRLLLKKAADAGVLKEEITRTLLDESQRLASLLEQFDQADWAAIDGHLGTAVEAAQNALRVLTDITSTLNAQLETANGELQLAKESLARVKQGKAPLSQNVETLMRELRDEGINPVAVCDVVRITKKEWQPAIEAYLAGNLQALLVREHEERRAFEVYCGLPEKRVVYGAKIVMESRQQVGRHPEPGSVAELIEGTDPAAEAYLRGLFGDMVCATTTAQAMERGKRTLTQDGMLVGKGTIERLKPVIEGDLRIGRDGGGQHLQAAEARHTACAKEVSRLAAEKQKLAALASVLHNIPPEDQARMYLKRFWDEADSAESNVSALQSKLQGAADKEYVALGEQEKQWSDEAKKLGEAVTDASGKRGIAENAMSERQKDVEAAAAKLTTASEAAEEARQDPEYDADYASPHWDVVLEKHGDSYEAMATYCETKRGEALREVTREVTKGSNLLGDFVSKYREQASEAVVEDWRKGQAWIADILKRLQDTELLDFKAQMENAYKVSQETFRNDVALALSQSIDALDMTMDQLNRVLKNCPAFTNGERYQFKRVVRLHFKQLLDFVKNIASFGPQEDLLGGAGEIPAQFKELLEDKIAPGAGSVKSPLDDYREFYEFDVEIIRDDPLTGKPKVVGHLSKRLGPGSGGEHRAPLYVIAGAALASAYRLDRDNRDGVRLILLDEAFNKMDPTNISATMRYLQDLGLQVLMASPGENLGVLTAYLHRYYDIAKDAVRNVILINGHDVTEETREMFMSDDLDAFPDLIEQEVNRMRGAGTTATQPA